MSAKPLANLRRERFVREYMKTGVASKAYAIAYPGDRADNVNWSAGWRLLRNVEVQKRLRHLRERAMKRADITVEKILTDYQKALKIAEAQGKASEIVMAAKEQARLVGMLVERRENGQAGEFDRMTDPADVLMKVEQEIGPEAAAALATAFGLAPEAEEIAVIEGPTDGDSIN